MSLTPVPQLKSKLGAWRAAIKKKAQKLIDDHLSQQDNVSPASSVREYVGWLKPNAKDSGSQDASFMFSNGLEYGTTPVRFPCVPRERSLICILSSRENI